MTVITNKLNAVREYRQNIINIAMNEVADNEAFILELITEEQLYEQGIRGDEVFIADYAPYSPFTVQSKQVEGKPTDRVTLRDEGDYHESFYLKIESDFFEVKAADWKSKKLIREYGEEIMQFTEENVNEIVWVYIYPKLIQKLQEALAR